MPRDDSLISLADYERAAEHLLEPPALSYFFGGAGDEITMRDNVHAWKRFAIKPRMLVGVAAGELSVTVLGRPRPHPLIIAPMASQGHADPEGDVATARAAAATGAVMCLSTLATVGVTELAHAAPDLTRWFQLYVFRDRAYSDQLVAQAVELGYEALVVTVDLPVLGVRERELRFPIEQGPSEMAPLIDPLLSWKDIERFASDCPLPLLVKGILTPEDARLAIEHGARGVIVSNHGGRQLDTVMSSADALAPIVDAVAGEIDVLVDGGIRRGTDILKALALGAQAVLVGRPILFGLVVGGSDGARRVLEILIAELDTALALAGVARAADLGRANVVPARWEVPSH
ncbi:MAG: alpha-hydroxy-acid oxidizing protein [Solirubrobacterales bacterium]|nr:alpha-hydroxy-acid oxidizing protein [Solirubrobacterales bacterium]